MSKIKSIAYPSITLIVLFLGGCTSKDASVSSVVPDDFLRNSFLQGIPCSPPCWHGLQVGISTSEDVLSTLAQLEFVDQTSIHELESRFIAPFEVVNSIGFSCRFAVDPEACGTLELYQDQLIFIGLVTADNISLGDMIFALGPPDFFQSRSYSNHGELCAILFYWVDEGIEAVNISPDIDWCNQIVDSYPGTLEITITNLHYWRQDIAETWIQDFPLIPWR